MRIRAMPLVESILYSVAVARTHGTGVVEVAALAHCGAGVVIEPGALIFHPENVWLGDDVYVGHQAILKGYYINQLRIEDGAWIGQQAFLHAAGGLTIGRRVGIGPGARIITSRHALPAGLPPEGYAIMDGPLELLPVVLEAGCDIGVGAIILPGVTVGRAAQVGAGAVVTGDVPPGAVVAGVPARPLR
jgi:acetyltransferase-like isoleucine patch superfamily enzyme